MNTRKIKLALIGSGRSSGGLIAVLKDLLFVDPPEELEVKLFCPDDYLKTECQISKKIEILVFPQQTDGIFNKLFPKGFSRHMIDAVDDFSPDAVFYIAGHYRKGLEKYPSFFVLNNQLYVSFQRIIKQRSLRVITSLTVGAIQFRRIIKKIDHFIFSSEFSRKDAEKHFKFIDSTVISFACNSIFLENSIYKDRNWRKKEKYNCLCIGSVIPYKNQLSVLKGIKKLISEGYDINITFVGSILSRPYYNQCCKYVELNNLKQNVKFIKWIPFDSIPSFIDRYDIYINSSELDTCGTSVEEGMARGIPVVANDTGFNREMLGNNAFYFNVDNPKSLSKTIKKLISDNDKRDCETKSNYVRARKWTLFNTAANYYDYILKSIKYKKK